MRSSTYVYAFALLALLATSAQAQTPVVTVVSNYTPAPTGVTYTLGGNTYRFGNRSGTVNNIQNIVGFSLPDGSYYYNVFVAGEIKIRRVNNPVVSGRRCLVWVEAVESPGAYNVLLPYVDSMELFFNGQSLNKGTDNLFGNQGDGSGNNNNIERVDWIVKAGMTAANPAQSGFPIFERGADNAHDPFCIAAVRAIDVNGNPTRYGPIVRVASSHYGNMMNSDLLWSILRKEEGEPLLYRTTAGVQRRGGVFVSMADLGVLPDVTIYGYSLFAHDLPASATPASLLNFTNATYFPTNTSSNTSLGGIDLIAIAGLYNIADGVVLPVSCRQWDAALAGAGILFNWKLENAAQCTKLEIEQSNDGVKWNSIATVQPVPGSFRYSGKERKGLYRLKMTVQGGGQTYSTIAVIGENEKPSISVTVQPGVLHLMVGTTFPGNGEVRIFNSAGTPLLRKAFMAGNEKIVLHHSLPPGIYIATLQVGSAFFSQKLVLR